MPTKTRLPFYNSLDPTYKQIWPDYTLIMPICAVGNIGQLACDLIISTLLTKQQCQLIGRLHSPALMSVVGPNAFALQGPPTTSTEVYESTQHKLVIIQQRTSYFKSLRDIYIAELVHWIKEAKFERVIVLTSSFAQCNPDTSQLGLENACPLRSITTNSFDRYEERWKSLGVRALPDQRSIKVVQDGLTFLPGSGLTKPLIRALEKEFVPAAFLIDFCSEGINICDCYEVVNIIDKYLNLGCNPDVSRCFESLKLGNAAICEISRDTAESHGGGWVEPFSWTQAQC